MKWTVRKNLKTKIDDIFKGVTYYIVGDISSNVIIRKTKLVDFSCGCSTEAVL